jgi:chemotaxis protein histidine kinase CheA
MPNVIKIAAVIASVYASSANADVTLTYELAGPEMQPQTKVFAISHFFARIQDPAEADTFLLYQAGKFFPLYQVDSAARTYTRLTPEVKPTLRAGSRPPEKAAEKAATTGEAKLAEAEQAIGPQTATPPEPAQTLEATANAAVTAPADPATAAEPGPATEAVEAQVSAATAADEPTTAAAAPELSSVEAQTSPAEAATAETPAQTATAAKPEGTAETAKPPLKATLRLTKKQKNIAGIPCREVEEIVNDKPVMVHCMADKARLRVTEREVRTLARTFEMARERELGWLGTATQDENFVSVATQDLQTNKTLTLKAVSTRPLPMGHLRIPREFKQVQD